MTDVIERTWRAVEDGLPPEGQIVDVWMHIYASPRSMGFSDDFRVTDAFRRGKKWFHEHEGREKELFDDYVTHWMPAPAPPERTGA